MMRGSDAPRFRNNAAMAVLTSRVVLSPQARAAYCEDGSSTPPAGAVFFALRASEKTQPGRVSAGVCRATPSARDDAQRARLRSRARKGRLNGGDLAGNVDLLRHALDNESAEFRYLLANRLEILECR